MAKKSIVKQKWFEKFLSPHVRWIKDVYSYSIQVSHLAIGLMGCFEVFTSGFAWAVLRTLGFYINFRQLAINGHQCCVLAHASPLSVLKHALRRKCSLMATPSKRDSVNAQSSFNFRSVDSQILLSGKTFWMHQNL